MNSHAQSPNRYAWLALVLASVLPLWLIGTMERGLWTPDEPREADIVWRMSSQADQVLPELANTKFLEKPPLSYWAGALALRIFGNHVWAMRLPNLLYAFVTTGATGFLALELAGPEAALIASLLAVSAFQMLRVELWLAPDACLLAGGALSLLGLYRGFTASRSRAQLSGYTLMHAGALIGFMAKSAVGWIIPALPLMALIAWEQRWRELRNWRLWFGLALQVVVIGTWMAAVLHEADGDSDLRILFWNNLAGRFTHVATHGAPNYAEAHLNWPGKYLSELPYYLFPWTLLLIPALQRAWHAVRRTNSDFLAWRFAIAAWLPFVLLLSCAVTARDVYFAPALIGICITIALWWMQLSQSLGRFAEWCLSMTRYASALLCLLMIACVVLLTLSRSFPVSEAANNMIGAGAVALLILLVAGLYRARLAQREARYTAMLKWCYLATIGSLTVGVGVISLAANRWQDLGELTMAIDRDVGTAKLAALLPDETTVAMLDYYAHRQVVTLDGKDSDATALVNDWFYVHSQRSRVLVLLPGHAPGTLSKWLMHAGLLHTTGSDQDDGVLRELEAQHVARVVGRYELPQGRRYALLAPEQN